jgi:heat-inducible transcriptional repressor
MTDERLEARTQQVLRAVIRDYILRAHPVGSGKITKKYRLNMSPATVRNIMACLEDLGLLERPHPSSGRIPTDSGFRYYVNTLMDPKPLHREEKEFILNRVQEAPHDVGVIMQETSRVLSHISHYTSLVSTPRISQTVFEQIDLIRLDRTRILMVLVSPTGVVYNRIIGDIRGLSQEDLDHAAEYLNRHIKGLPLEEAKQKIMEQMEAEKDQYDRILSRVWNSSRRVLEAEQADVYVDGQSNILDYPEFSEDLHKMKSLLRAFEEKEIMLQLLDMAMEGLGIQVYIGGENQVEEMADCSLIATTYHQRGVALGTLGLIGPKRMDYSRMIPLVDFTAKAVGAKLEEMEGQLVGS